MDPVWAANNNVSLVVFNNDSAAIQPLEALGPPGQFFLVTLYSLTSFLAFVGNVIVIFVEVFGKRSARTLRKFLINLAISDILIGVFVVPFIYTDFMLGRWIFPHSLCPLSYFVQVSAVFVTAFTLTTIGVERLVNLNAKAT